MVIQTFVFLDFEATGLPAKEQNRTKAIELSLLAASRCDIEKADGRNLPSLKKLTFRCNPGRKMTSEAATLTGLTNDLLRNEPIFKKNIKYIDEFLNLPEPVCLVAHSGDRLDFRLLRAEYNDAGATLPSKLLCVDSFKAFKDLSYHGHFRVRSFALKNLYRNFVKKEPTGCHKSESDCLMLLECVIAKKDVFLEWADVNCKGIYKVISLRGT